jgi:hypothetical protein
MGQGAYWLSNLQYFNHPNTYKKQIKTVETTTNTIALVTVKSSIALNGSTLKSANFMEISFHTSRFWPSASC